MSEAIEFKNSYYDNTKLSTYKTCPRQYYFRHVRTWRKEGTALPLVFGLSWHNAMDIVWSLVNKKSDEEVLQLAYAKFIETWCEADLPHPDEMELEQIAYYEPRTPQIAAEMLWEYIQHRKEYIANVEIIAVEMPFAVPMQTGDNCNRYYIGRIDKVVRNKQDGRIYPIEHKTTSMYKGRAPDHVLKPDYIEGWTHHAQIDGYLNSSFMIYGKDVKAILVDAALVHKKTHDVFKFIPIERMLSDLDTSLFDAIEWSDRVEADKAKLKHYQAQRAEGSIGNEVIMPCFPKNTEQCQGKYNSTCGYFDICRYGGNPEAIELPPEGFVADEWNPFDLHGIDKLGLENK